MNEWSSTIDLCCFSLSYFLQVNENLHQHLNGNCIHPLTVATGWLTDGLQIQEFDKK